MMNVTSGPMTPPTAWSTLDMETPSTMDTLGYCPDPTTFPSVCETLPTVPDPPSSTWPPFVNLVRRLVNAAGPLISSLGMDPMVLVGATIVPSIVNAILALRSGTRITARDVEDTTEDAIVITTTTTTTRVLPRRRPPLMNNSK